MQLKFLLKNVVQISYSVVVQKVFKISTHFLNNLSDSITSIEVLQSLLASNWGLWQWGREPETETKTKTKSKTETFWFVVAGGGNKGLHDKEAYQLQLHEFSQPD